MIKELQDYITSLYSNMTYGQIPDTPDNLLNLNIYDTGRNPFFGDNSTHILTLDLYVRDTSFENMLDNNELVCNSLLNLYDIDISNIHIVLTKKTSGQQPQRDDKNRYSQYSSFEMTVEEV